VLLAPDDLLPQGPRRWTRETVGEAWRTCRRALREALADPSITQVACLIGIPGAGKSTWAAEHEQDGLVVFDACWTDPGKRAGLARQIRAAGRVPIAVWVRTPLALCRERNAARPAWRRVPEAALLRAAVALRHHPPTRAEGWAWILEVDGEERIDASVPLERQLERAARLPANRAWRILRGSVLPELARAQPGEGIPAAVERRLRTMERQLARQVDERAAVAVARLGPRIEARERRAWDEKVSREIGQEWRAPVTDVQDWTNEVTDRIIGIRQALVPGIRASILEARRLGWSARDLERAWKQDGLPLEGYGTAEGRAVVYAQESAAQLVHRSLAEAQASAGAEWYEWQHRPSRNPRPEHQARHGRRFRRGQVQDEPGQLPNCHCRAIPVLTAADVARLRA